MIPIPGRINNDKGSQPEDPTSLRGDPPEGSAMGRVSVLRLQEEGRCGEQHQSLCIVQRPRQPLTDAINYQTRR